MGYNLAKIKMTKKIFVTATLLVAIIASAMVFSSFKAPKENTTISKIEMNASTWKKFREGVAYCDGDKGTCMGTGDVWVNTDTYQIQFRIGNGKYDLTEYTGKDGYNMRFWHSGADKYYYVNIFIPRSAFD